MNLLYVTYIHENNLYGQAILRKSPVAELELVSSDNFTKGLIKNYHENSDEGYIPEADINYPELWELSHNELLCQR